MLDNRIIFIVHKLSRNYQRGIFPWMVQPWLGCGVCEQTLRRHMVRLWREGKLQRVGGPQGRQGYRVPTAASALQFEELPAQQRAQLHQRLAALHRRQSQQRQNAA